MTPAVAAFLFGLGLGTLVGFGVGYDCGVAKERARSRGWSRLFSELLAGPLISREEAIRLYPNPTEPRFEDAAAALGLDEEGRYRG